jgi:hypothetical protein
MRKGFLGSLAAWLLGAGLALAQTEEMASSEALPPPTPLFSGPKASSGLPLHGTPVGETVSSEALPPSTAMPSEPKTSSGLPLYGTQASEKDSTESLPPPSGAAPGVKTSSGLPLYGAPEGGDGEGPAGPGCSSCGGSGYPPAAVGPVGNDWVTAAPLYWWTKKGHVPPLVTTGPLSSGGVLGNSGTQVLFGGSNLDIEEQTGGRFGFGLWLTDFHRVGAEFNYFFLGTSSVDFNAVAAGNALLTRPFTDANTGQQNAFLTAIPGLTEARIRVKATNRLQGLEINGLANPWSGANYRCDVLFGFRWMEMNEGLGISQDVGLVPGLPGFGARNLIADQFDTQNRFYGAQIGARGEYYWGRLSLNLSGQVALGSTRQDLTIRGVTVVTAADGTMAAQGSGLLALPSNSGGFDRNRVAFVPELGIKVNYQLSPCMRLFAGYNFLYWSDVIRSGEQIDTTINPNQVGTPPPFNPQLGVARPAVLFKGTDYWAQGVTIGMEFRF